MKATNIKDGKRIPVFHGENFFVPVESISGELTKETKSYVAGHSETGHHHVIESDAPIKVYEEKGKRAVLLEEVGKLFHQKTFDVHETTYLAPGVYQIIHKTEYDPFQKIIRAVFD